LAEAGLEPTRDFEVVVHDRLVGKHGDHIGGERDAVKALVEGRVDAACILDQNRLLFARDGTRPSGVDAVLLQTAQYDHCNFTVLDDAPSETVARFRDLLRSMSYEDATVRPLLDLEGLKAWVDGRTSGYAQLERAVDRFDTLGPWLTRLGAR
jgi:ABC-type phosphate/phosphonate transport system substrate-binding protein